MAHRLITAPTIEPVSLAEAKLHCRVDTTDEDASFTRWIQGAREQAEHLTERSLLPQTWEWTQDRFGYYRLIGMENFLPNPGSRVPFEATRIDLPRPPVTAVTWVKYLDSAGVTQTLDPSFYVADIDNEPGGITLAPGKSWPVTWNVPNAVRVRYTAGYPDAASVPANIKNFILLLVGTLYKFRELDIDATQALQRSPHIVGLLDRGRIWSL